MHPRDTTFVGSTDEVPDEEVISCIKSVPCHYRSGLRIRVRGGIAGVHAIAFFAVTRQAKA
jgi:hypothetical protein